MPQVAVYQSPARRSPDTLFLSMYVSATSRWALEGRVGPMLCAAPVTAERTETSLPRVNEECLVGLELAIFFQGPVIFGYG